MTGKSKKQAKTKSDGGKCYYCKEKCVRTDEGHKAHRCATHGGNNERIDRTPPPEPEAV